MAMTQCKECGSAVSDEAKNCPSCGAPVPKGWTAGKIVVVIIGIAIVINIASKSGGESKTDPEADGRAAAAKRLADQRVQRAGIAATAIKQTLRDPESVRWEQIFTSENGDLVCIEYRAKNGFGGYEGALMVLDGKDVFTAAKDWESRCVGRAVFDTGKVKALL